MDPSQYQLMEFFHYTISWILFTLIQMLLFLTFANKTSKQEWILNHFSRGAVGGGGGLKDKIKIDGILISCRIAKQ